MRVWNLADLVPNVTPIPGEPLRYWVGSRSRWNMKHTVDLTLQDGIGECSCEKWAYQMGPNIKQGKVKPSEIECPHILSVRRYLALQAVLKVVAAERRRGRAPS